MTRNSFKVHQVGFMLLVSICFFHTVYPTSCPIDPLLEATEPGNAYECPDTLPDGLPNEYNFCCQADRPDENGDSHTCCQDPDLADGAKMQEFYNICIIIVCVTLGLMTAVFVHTYCHNDTFPCLIPLKREVRKYKNMVMDSLCFCSCCPKFLRRKTKKEFALEKEQARAEADVDPSQMEVPQDFWI